MKKANKLKLSYEPDADVLSYEISGKPIDFAKEIGDMIVHFTKDDEPVLIEILSARKFLAEVIDITGTRKGVGKKTLSAVR